MLRIGRARYLRGEAEEVGVEFVDAVHQCGAPHVRVVRQRLLGNALGQQIVFGQRDDRLLAAAQVVPECRQRVGTRQAGRHADHRDRVGRQFAVAGHTRSPTFRRAAARCRAAARLLGSVTNPAAAVGLVVGLQAQLADQVGGQCGQRRALQQQGHGRFHSEVAANSVADSYRHKRIHAQFGQRLVGVEGAALRVAHDGQDAGGQSPDDDPVHLGGVQLAQRVGAGPVVVLAVDVEFVGQLGEEAELLNLRERGRGPVQPQPGHTDVGGPAGQDGLQRLDALGRRNRVQRTECQRAGHTDVGPLAPVDRGGRQSRRPSPVDQAVQPGAGGRVGPLPGCAQQRRRRREAEPPVELFAAVPEVTTCRRSAPIAFGAHTRSRLSWLRPATIWSSSTTALCIRPRNVSPVSSAALTSFSATPGAAISPSTTAIWARCPSSSISACASSDGSDRPLSTTRPAPLSTSQRAMAKPSPRRPPVMNVGAVRPNDRLGLGRAECRAGKPLYVTLFAAPADDVVAGSPELCGGGDDDRPAGPPAWCAGLGARRPAPG